MNKDKARYIASVMIAWADGKNLQFKTSSSDWIRFRFTGTTPNFTEEGLEWRVEPEPFECWVILDTNGDYYKHLKNPPPETAVLHYRELKYTIHHMREVL